jgi:LuxR family transcriptional regulator, quorum-sensing system regulator CinR
MQLDGLKIPVASSDQKMLVEAFSIIEDTPELDVVVSRLRDLLTVEHVVYHSSKFGSSPTADPFIRLTYPAEWIKRYLQMQYGDLDPVVREGFQRKLPFSWGDLAMQNRAEVAFFQDAASHGVGPNGYSIPVISKHGHRGLFSISSSVPASVWKAYVTETQSDLIQIANRLHSRVVSEVFGHNRLNLTARELECLRWVALGKGANEIAAILQISPHTARDYLKSARFKLDCVTSAQAATKAIKLRLVIL